MLLGLVQSVLRCVFLLLQKISPARLLVFARKAFVPRIDSRKMHFIEKKRKFFISHVTFRFLVIFVHFSPCTFYSILDCTYYYCNEKKHKNQKKNKQKYKITKLYFCKIYSGDGTCIALVWWLDEPISKSLIFYRSLLLWSEWLWCWKERNPPPQSPDSQPSHQDDHPQIPEMHRSAASRIGSIT